MKTAKPTPPEWWEEQAKEDMITAKVNLEAERYYAAAFFAHQVAEKLLKAKIIRSKEVIPYTHSMSELLAVHPVPDAIHEAVMDLAPEYGRAKCPYHAHGVPARICDLQRAKTCIEHAETVMKWALG